MWIYTKSGFLSIVQDENDPGWRLVRARRREALEAFIKEYDGGDVVIHTEPDADYRFRIYVPAVDLGDWLRYQALAIDYPNFKNACADAGADNQTMSVLHGVWAETRRLQLTPREYDLPISQRAGKRKPNK